ncbi:membrane protein FAM174A isoform X2 [Neopsephotus bourkii]|uniref:membrane protein FAM174A isoform X2 n=1 Tax=Neopsephotus bourkii TaxID=309878 RepID=UPI002AA59885|nr:membrane protein FAM174A isoform X2 [Neopsephotus bourkii]
MAAAGARRTVLPLPAARRRQGPATLRPRRTVGCGGGGLRRAGAEADMRPPPLPWLLAGLLLAARCGEAAAEALHLRSANIASPLPTEVAGGAATRSSSSSRLAEVSGPPEQRQPMTQRALSVLVLASAALIVYFVIRTVRIRRRSRKTRRYGVLDTNIENMELTPLEQDDDDDDTTLFDANHPPREVRAFQ